jgi:hypothetical protein
MGKTLEIIRADLRGTALSGDGGNRTRVRKNRSADIYEHSRLLVSPAEVQTTKDSAG